MTERKFSLYDIEQFIREAGAEKVTEDAVLDLEKELEKLAERITNKAIMYAEHAGRKKLIRKSDILLTGGVETLEGGEITYRYKRPNYKRCRNLRPKAKRTKTISMAQR